MVADLKTYLTKAIPDTRLTIEKYADAKFEYLVSSDVRRHYLCLINIGVDLIWNDFFALSDRRTPT